MTPQAILRAAEIMQNQSPVTLLPAPGDTGFTSQTYVHARKKPLTQGKTGLQGGYAEVESVEFTLVRINETVLPRKGMRIQDSGGTIYQIDTVRVKLFGGVFNCSCTENAV